MNNLRNIIILLLCLWVQNDFAQGASGGLHLETSSSQTLHLLLFCDTEDSRVGSATANSLKYFSGEFANRVKDATGMYVKTYSYSGSNFSLSYLESALSSLSVSSNDAILFYFDGHGWNNGSNEYPMLTFGNSGDLNSRSKSLQSVYTTLKNKGSRLTIVMANACNKEVAVRANVAGRYIAQNAPINDNRTFFQRLFLNSSGSLITCSSQKGQASQSDGTGAWFFLGLREKVDEMQYDNNITWGSLMSGIKSKTATIAGDNGYMQNPYFQDYTSIKTAPNISIPKMVYVEGGTFKMANNYNVTLSSYYLGVYEVTVGEYMQFVNDTKAHYPEWLRSESNNDYNIYNGSSKDYYKKTGISENAVSLPIVGVYWNDAIAYCKWLSQKTGQTYCLPTEAQWQFAAQGGKNGNGYKYAGSNNIDDVAWYIGNSGGQLHTVGVKVPNELGLYDMSGNAWEYCSDKWGDYPSGNYLNPTGPSGNNEVRRGGGWGNNSGTCASNNHYFDTFSYLAMGFRLCKMK